MVFCALSTNKDVKCWGQNTNGQLGYGHTNNLGDSAGEMGNNLPVVDVGMNVAGLYGGGGFVCALEDAINPKLRCWGSNSGGKLGRGDLENIGDEPNEMGVNLTDVDFGTNFVIKQVAVAIHSVCAVGTNGDLKCFGSNEFCQLGLEVATSEHVGNEPNEMGDNLDTVNLGTGWITKFVYGGGYVSICAVSTSDDIKCWGRSEFGILGQGDTTTRGCNVNDMGDGLPIVDLNDTPSPTQDTTNPTMNPSTTPSDSPTQVPSNIPTYSPTTNPTNNPTAYPTNDPTTTPTNDPSNDPTTTPTKYPTNIPTTIPTNNPSITPTSDPTINPTNNPSNDPTKIPTTIPTNSPSIDPTNIPTNDPSNTPTEIPSDIPSRLPTNPPTTSPTSDPSSFPTNVPSNVPTNQPSNLPTTSPTNDPSLFPTKVPSNLSTNDPSNLPTTTLTNDPSNLPSNNPSNPSHLQPLLPTELPTTLDSDYIITHIPPTSLLDNIIIVFQLNDFSYNTAINNRAALLTSFKSIDSLFISHSDVVLCSILSITNNIYTNKRIKRKLLSNYIHITFAINITSNANINILNFNAINENGQFNSLAFQSFISALQNAFPNEIISLQIISIHISQKNDDESNNNDSNNNTNIISILFIVLPILLVLVIAYLLRGYCCNCTRNADITRIAIN